MSEAPKVRTTVGRGRAGAGRPRKGAYDAQKEYKRSKNRMPAEVKAHLGDDPSPMDFMQLMIVWHIENARLDEALRIANKLAIYVHPKVVAADPNEASRCRCRSVL